MSTSGIVPGAKVPSNGSPFAMHNYTQASPSAPSANVGIGGGVRGFSGVKRMY